MKTTEEIYESMLEAVAQRAGFTPAADCDLAVRLYAAAAELQALEFVVLELAIYLDTHQDDTEAFQLFQQYSAMEKSARAAYEEKYGPLTKGAAATGSSYQWLSDPWPWNYEQNEVK